MRIKPFKPAAETKVKLVAVITAVCLLGDAMLYVVLPIHGGQFGIQSLWHAGVLLSINRFVRIPIHPIIGWFYSKYNLKFGLLIAIVLTAVSTFFYGLFDGFWLLLIARCIWGVAWAFLKQGGQLQIVASMEEIGGEGGKLSGIYNGVYGIGVLLGMLIGGLATTLHGADNILFVFGSIALLTLPIVYGMEGVPVIPIKQVEKRGLINRELLPLIVIGFLLTLIFQGYLKSTMSYWVDQQNYAWIPFMQAMGTATITGLLMTVKLSLDPFFIPWIGMINDRRASRSKLLKIFLIISSGLFLLFPLQMNIIIWLCITFLLLFLSTALMTLNDAQIFQYAAGNNRHRVITGYSIASDLGAAAGPLLGFVFISLFGNAAVAWGASVLLIMCALTDSMIIRVQNHRIIVKQTVGGSRSFLDK